VEADGAVVYRELYDMFADPEECANISSNGENSLLMDSLAVIWQICVNPRRD